MTDILVKFDLDDGAPVECENCDWVGKAGEMDAINRLTERVAPGEIMPAGECPECGALCHISTEPLTVSDGEYTLKKAHDRAWVNVRDVAVCIVETGEGVIVNLYGFNRKEAIATMGATFEEMMD